jgi:phosphopantothenoylcysteine synthetase/decarboxylase
MNCVVTAGPTYESLDNVRRLTNFSTGRLGSELADYLTARGHRVTLLLGEQATYGGAHKAERVERFSTTADLGERLKRLGGQVGAIFHAAAVSDFTFGKVWLRSAQGEMTEVKSGKLSTRQGTLLAELVPTPKIISELRNWHPTAKLVGWKYEVDGNRAGVIGLAERQMAECHTDACVANGKAYGLGFGLVTGAGKCVHLAQSSALFAALAELVGEAGELQSEEKSGSQDCYI